MMPEKLQKTTSREWACRILVTAHFLLVTAGYLVYTQTRYQLVTPLIPRDTVLTIAGPYLYTSLCAGVTFLVSMWLYFLRRRIACIVASAVSLGTYKFLLLYFTMSSL